MVGTPATPLYDRIPQSNGLLFGSYSEAGTFITVKDPQCGKLPSSLQPLCTLNAVADAKPGRFFTRICCPAREVRWDNDRSSAPGSGDLMSQSGSGSKSAKRKPCRFASCPQCAQSSGTTDAKFQHQSTASPFGAITTKTLGGFVNASATQRTFQGQLRFNFEILFGNWAIGTSANCAAPKHKRRRRSPEESKKNSLDEFPSWLNSTRRKASFWISCRCLSARWTGLAIRREAGCAIPLSRERRSC